MRLRNPPLAAPARLLTGLLALVLLAACTAPVAPPDQPPPGEPPAQPTPDPERLTGSGEDQTLALAVALTRQEDGSYQVVATIRNRSEQSVDLLYDCGSLVRLHLRPAADEGAGGDVACPSVESMLLEAGRSTEERWRLPAGGPELDLANARAWVVYRTSGPGGQQRQHTLTVRLRAPEA